MSRWWAVILIVATLAGQGRGQENEQVHALARRVKLEPERRDFTNSLDDFDEAATLRLAGQLLLPAPPHSTSGFQILASRFGSGLPPPLRAEVSPNSTGFRPPVSAAGAQIAQVRCVCRFRHSSWISKS